MGKESLGTFGERRKNERLFCEKCTSIRARIVQKTNSQKCGKICLQNGKISAIIGMLYSCLKSVPFGRFDLCDNRTVSFYLFMQDLHFPFYVGGTTMTKLSAKALCLLLAAACAAGTLSGCSKKKYDEDGNEIIDKGAEINAYLSDFPTDLDPGRIQYDSDLGKFYSLIYESLFAIDENGKLTGALAKEWEYEVDERDDKLKLVIKLASTSWSDGVAVDADDVTYAFKRLLNPENVNPAASLLFPIENARAAKEGLMTIDDVGFSAVNSSTVEIVFEKEFTDVEYFLRCLANPIFTPLREDVVYTYGDDWAQPFELKKLRDGEDTVNSIVTNGPFQVKQWTRDGMVLERSSYYRNLGTDDNYTKYVTPYRIILNFTEDVDEQLAKYDVNDSTGIFYIADFSKDGYTEYEKKIDSYDAASMYTYYFNAENPLLSDARVRKALSIALDRNEIAEIVGRGVKAADGYVPTGVKADAKGKTDYRDKADSVIDTNAQLDAAKALLNEAGVKKGSLTLTIRGDRDWEKEVAEYAKEVWKQLGISVKIDTSLATKSSKQSEISEFEQALAAGEFDIIGIDQGALSEDAYSFLAPYAVEFSGNAVSVDDDAEPYAAHITGMNNAEYNALFLGEYVYYEDGEFVESTGILGAEKAAERFEIYTQAEAILAEEVPSAPLFYKVNNYLTSGKLSKVSYTSLGTPDLNDTKLKNYAKYKTSETGTSKKASKKADSDAE